MLVKESFISIKKNYKRYISLVLIILLGVGFYAGIKASSPDMKDTLNHFYQEHNLYDFQLISELGILEEDVTELKNESNTEAKAELIKVEDSDKYIKLTFNKFVTNFNVHAGTWEKQQFQDQRLIYQNGYLKENSIIYIQKRLNYEYIRISFENQYHTKFSIIPMIDESQNKMIFKTEKTTQ